MAIDPRISLSAQGPDVYDPASEAQQAQQLKMQQQSQEVQLSTLLQQQERVGIDLKRAKAQEASDKRIAELFRAAKGDPDAFEKSLDTDPSLDYSAITNVKTGIAKQRDAYMQMQSSELDTLIKQGEFKGQIASQIIPTIDPDDPKPMMVATTQAINAFVQAGIMKKEEAAQILQHIQGDPFVIPDLVESFMHGTTAEVRMAQVARDTQARQIAARQESRAGETHTMDMRLKNLQISSAQAELEGALAMTKSPQDLIAAVDRIIPTTSPEFKSIHDSTVEEVKLALRTIPNPIEAVKAARAAITAGSNRIDGIMASEAQGKTMARFKADITNDPSQLPGVITARPGPEEANVIDPKTGYTPMATFQNALAFAITGAMPSMGMRASGQVANARAAIQNTAAALSDQAGIDFPTLRAEYKANGAALNKVVPLYYATKAAEEAATENIKLVREASKNYDRTQVPRANRFVAWVKGELKGDPTLTRLEVLIYAASREYAKVTSGAAGSVQGLTDSASAQVGHLMSAFQNPAQLETATQAMMDEMANFVAAQSNQIESISSAVSAFARTVGTNVAARRLPEGAVITPDIPAPSKTDPIVARNPYETAVVDKKDPNVIHYFNSVTKQYIRSETKK